MKDALEALEALPGVALAMLTTTDGVPIAHVGAVPGEARHDAGAPETTREEAVAALAAGWADELVHAVAPLSWAEPQRVVLRCARGALVLRPMRNALLLLLLESTVAAEDVRLSMEVAVAKIERGLRAGVERSEPPGPIPSRPRASSEVETHRAHETTPEGGLSRD